MNKKVTLTDSDFELLPLNCNLIWSRGYKAFFISCLNQMSMKLQLLMKGKMLKNLKLFLTLRSCTDPAYKCSNAIIGISIFMSRINFS